MLAGRCNCGAVARNEVVGGRFFEVVPQDSGCRILVFEREFFTQKEWEQQYTCVTNQVSQFLTRTNQTQTEAVRGVAAFDQMGRLPGWSYNGIGVDVDVQCPEIVYPGLEKDSAAAQLFFEEVVSLLKPYHRADKGLRPRAAAPGT